MKQLRIVLADDHALLRAGMRVLLERFGTFTIIGEAGSGREAIQAVEEHKPDIVLMDIAMPDLNGLEALRRISAEWPAVKVVMLSMHGNKEYVLRAMRGGAAGYVLKDTSPSDLAMALQIIARGTTYISPGIGMPMENYHRATGAKLDSFSELTPRQREILQLIAERNSTKEIACTLGLSIKTVEMHRARLMARLQIYDVAGLVHYAIRQGLVSV